MRRQDTDDEEEEEEEDEDDNSDDKGSVTSSQMPDPLADPQLISLVDAPPREPDHTWNVGRLEMPFQSSLLDASSGASMGATRPCTKTAPGDTQYQDPDRRHTCLQQESRRKFANIFLAAMLNWIGHTTLE